MGCEESFEKTCLKLCSLMGTFITHVAILDFKNEVKKKEILEIIHTLEIELKILKKLYK
ncbi:hypothetical protein [Methanococcus voltae]|uniref:hypothetical protein n=1 Tax=Methanococcus voltae TaxID=2188 RepID=UPI001AE323DD|nr:hypothetical protein [Methanococcus voltae]